MAQVKNLIAKWGAAWPSPMIISRQYDNGQYRIDLFNYPEAEHIVDEQTEQMEVLSYYLIVWMKETEDGEPREMSPIQLPGPYWIVPNYYTQLVQDIKFQFCVQSDSTDYEAHSAIFTGRIVDSIEHDGDPVDVTPAEMFDAYKAYVNDLIVAAGDVQIDTSLSVSGAAADAKAVGDALSSTNERLLSSFPVDTAQGAIASFTDGADNLPLKSLVVGIEPKQSGSGDPSPTNVRPISGWTEAEVTANGSVIPITFPSAAGTVYGGSLDVTNGVLTVDKAIVDLGTLNWTKESSYIYAYSQSTYTPKKKPGLDNVICDSLKTTASDTATGMAPYTIRGRATDSILFVRIEDSMTGAQVKEWLSGKNAVYELDTPVTYQLTPTEIRSLLGTNNLWADTGGTSVEYRADPTMYISRKIAEAISALS